MIKKIVFILLYPFSVLYNLITSIRNLLFDVKVFKGFTPEVFSAGVGNLTVGGTGKTPTADYLIRLFREYNTAVLSRGYGRQTRGFIELTHTSRPEEVGDEPKMLFDKHRDSANFFVGEDRVEAGKKIMSMYPETKVLLLDDVYQHRHFKPNLMILLCDYNRPFYNDHLLPAGRLRESRRGAKRADIILVTKCPIFSNNSEKELIEIEIRKYSDEKASIYFSSFESGRPGNDAGDLLEMNQKVVLISGIAQNQRFYETVSSEFSIEEHFAFPDHYSYSISDIEKVQNLYPDLPVITTEKDLVKIRALTGLKMLHKIYFIPLQLKIDKEEAFKSEVLTSFMSHSKIKRAF